MTVVTYRGVINNRLRGLDPGADLLMVLRLEKEEVTAEAKLQRVLASGRTKAAREGT